jgi:hypothetical protein
MIKRSSDAGSFDQSVRFKINQYFHDNFILVRLRKDYFFIFSKKEALE